FQDEVARDIANKLQLRLTSQQQQRISRPATQSSEAYELYLKGRYEWIKRSQGGLKKAADYFQQAINADPNYALAYAGLGSAYALFANYWIVPPQDSSPKAEAAVHKALELDANLAEAHAVLGLLDEQWRWDWAAGDSEFKRALQLNPGLAT